jgi:tetratricopeptide (TPR) repeat protein
MICHARMPAVIAMALTAAVGLGIMAATGQFRTTDISQATLEQLEKRIATSQDGQVWMAYGDKLRAAGRPEAAAEAYERAVRYQPDLAEARLKLGLALAAGKEADLFFDYVLKLCIHDAGLADDLMKRPELAPLQGHARWQSTAVTARARAID